MVSASSNGTPINNGAYQPSPRVIDNGGKFLMAYPRNSLYWRIMSRMAIFATGFISRMFVKTWNKTEVYNRETLQEVFRQAELEKRGIITVMNHVSILDDPLVWGGTVPLSRLASPAKMRWTLGAKDICFKNRAESMFFSLGQVLCVERFGKGPDQPAIDAAIRLISEGKWVHSYPEGFVHQPYSPFEGTLRYFHWGLSRLILESGPNAPIVLPIYGKGLQTVFPEDRKKKVFGYSTKEPITFAFGEPLDIKKLTEFRKQWSILAQTANGEVTPEIKQLRSKVASHVRSAVVNTKKHITELLENDSDPRLADPNFWKSQVLIKLKGKSMDQKRQKSIDSSQL